MTCVSYDIAKAYVDAGVSILPIGLDGEKRPFYKRLPTVAATLSDPSVPEIEKRVMAKEERWRKKWVSFQYRLPTPMETLRMFKRPAGIGLICGLVSGGLEVIDFDDDAETVFPAWKEKLSPEIRGQLSVVETGGGGYHILYRCDEISGNEKLAMSAVGKRTIIETRGQCGYIVGVGSPTEVHSSGQPYVQVAGVPLPNFPTFTPEQRKDMFAAAATFDKRKNVMDELVKRRVRQLLPQVTDIDTDTPWGDVDARATWPEVLEPHGWYSADGTTWTRPGKDSGTSAKVCIGTNGCELLTVFSSNADPLSADVGANRTWGKFGAYAALNFAGNRREAARAAVRAGYGRRAGA